MPLTFKVQLEGAVSTRMKCFCLRLYEATQQGAGTAVQQFRVQVPGCITGCSGMPTAQEQHASLIHAAPHPTRFNDYN